jgi:hypothetical protein
MRKTSEDLISILNRIGKTGEALDDIAGGLLRFVKAKKIYKIDDLNEEIAKAYKASGWSQTKGRPSAESQEKPAPKAVKVYISQLRAGYLLNLEVWKFATMGALKVAVNEARAKERPATEAPQPEMQGIKLSSDDKLIGALFHDVAVLWKTLPESERPAVERRLKRIIADLSKTSHLKLVGAA